MRISLIFLFLAVILAVALSQDSNADESPVPRKTLRRYRIRRPIQQQTSDEDGTPKPTGENRAPRIRRIRVKARPTAVPVEDGTSDEPQFAAQTAEPVSPTEASFRQFQQLYNEEQQVIEQNRDVPQYRTATPSNTRTAILAKQHLREQTRVRGDEEERKTIGTTRNYSNLNEDGSFTFGYEAEDGSFKEETRGIDCVVRGKYGYVDPDGVRREFSYVSGNPCDPNNPEGNDETVEDDEAAAPAPRPILRRVRPEVAQNELQGITQTAEEKLPEDQLAVFFRQRPQQIVRRRPTAAPSVQATTFRPRIRITSATPAPTPAGPAPEFIQPFIYRQRPAAPSAIPTPQAIAELDNALPQGRSLFNFRNEVQRLTQQQVQQVQPQQFQPQPSAAPSAQPDFFNQAPPQNFYHTHTFPQRQVFGNFGPTVAASPAPSTLSSVTPTAAAPVATTARATASTPTAAAPTAASAGQFGGNYRTELVYDPNTNQYTSVLVRPESDGGSGEITLSQRLRGFVDPQRPNQFQIQQFGQPQVQYFGNPQHLLQGHQERLQQQQQQQQQPFFQPQQPAPTPFSAFNPNNPFLAQQQQQAQQQQFDQFGAGLPVRQLQGQGPTAASSIPQLHADAQQLQALSTGPSAAGGQIDAFLRGLNLNV